MRPKNSDYENDTEFQQFQESIKDKSPSTAKSYKASYKKVRDLLGNHICRPETIGDSDSRSASYHVMPRRLDGVNCTPAFICA